jgi:glucosamine--fructose-6-phosphate aminotransferase (isomerizing)
MESKTCSEIQAQYKALKKTLDLISKKRSECRSYFQKTAPDQIVVLGCGSSFQLAESVAMSAQIRTGVASTALPGGDLMLHIRQYAPLFSGKTLVIALSRSGSTSEVLNAIGALQKQFPAFPCAPLPARLVPSLQRYPISQSRFPGRSTKASARRVP